MHSIRSHRTAKIALALLATTTLSSQAVITAVSTSDPVATGAGGGFFSDGSGDYFGVVDNTGTMIEGLGFSASDTTPPVGALAGRDIDDGNALPATRTAEWQLSIAGIPGAASPFTNISFSGTIAANTGWDNFVAPDTDFVTLELLLDGVVLTSETKDFRPVTASGGSNFSLALDTNADGVGDGALVPATGGQNFALNGTTANSTVVVRLTVHADSSAEEFWVSGTLNADVDVVPEPSSSLLLTLASGFLILRRKK